MGLGEIYDEEIRVFQADTRFEHISMETWDIYLEEIREFQADTRFEHISME